MAELKMPARMKVVSDTTGFVESKGSRGACFEWYKLEGNEWKASHIFHEENYFPYESGVVYGVGGIVPLNINTERQFAPGFMFCAGVT
jgi:hypothetical protein